MPCSQRRHHNHRFARRFHPHMARMMMGHHQHFAEMMEEEFSPFLQGGKVRISEPSSGEQTQGEDTTTTTNHYYEIQMAVPGVKAHHITIEENNGELEIVAIRLGGKNNEEIIKTYQDVLFLHPSKADFSKLVATIKDGILTVRVPKKLDEVVTIETMSAPAPPPPPSASTGTNQKKSTNEDDEDNIDDAAMEEEAAGVEQEDFHISLDLPGVSVGSLSVEMYNNRDEDQLQVTAERRLPGGAISQYHRTITVPPSIDMAQAHAYLQDGVFTLIAPHRQVNEQEQEQGGVGVRTFYATPEEDPILPEAVAALKINEEASDSKSSTQMTVETVNQEWEEVEPESSSAEQQNIVDAAAEQANKAVSK